MEIAYREKWMRPSVVIDGEEIDLGHLKQYENQPSLVHVPEDLHPWLNITKDNRRTPNKANEPDKKGGSQN